MDLGGGLCEGLPTATYCPDKLLYGKTGDIFLTIWGVPREDILTIKSIDGKLNYVWKFNYQI